MTGEPLVQRPDDKEETVRKRLEVHDTQTRPLVEYYARRERLAQGRSTKYRSVDGLGSVDEVTQRVLQALAS